MKKLKSLFLLILVTLTISCNQQSDVTETISLEKKTEKNYEEGFVEILIPESLKSSEPPSEEAGYLIQEIEIPVSGGRIVQGKMSIVTEDHFIHYVGLSEDLMDELGLTEHFWIEYVTDSGTSARKDGLADCLEKCRDKHEKGKGRGKCKAGCWGEAIIDVIKEVIKVFQ